MQVIVIDRDPRNVFDTTDALEAEGSTRCSREGHNNSVDKNTVPLADAYCSGTTTTSHRVEAELRLVRVKQNSDRALANGIDIGVSEWTKAHKIIAVGVWRGIDVQVLVGGTHLQRQRTASSGTERVEIAINGERLTYEAFSKSRPAGLENAIMVRTRRWPAHSWNVIKDNNVPEYRLFTELRVEAFNSTGTEQRAGVYLSDTRVDGGGGDGAVVAGGRVRLVALHAGRVGKSARGGWSDG